MTRVRPPVWTATSSRFAGVARGRAIGGLAVVALLILGALTALWVPTPDAGVEGGSIVRGASDLDLYESIVAGVRSGGHYYDVAANALRAGDYPLKPFVAFRLPTLAVTLAWMSPLTVAVTLWALVAAVFIAWFVRLRDQFTRLPAMVVLGFLLAGGLIAYAQADLAPFHEIWAGLLIALSLAIRRRDRWVEAVAIGLAAMAIRETAALFAVLMAMLAFAEGNRREACAWAGALGIFALMVGAHAFAVADVVKATDPASPGWSGFNGFGFFVGAVTQATAFQMLPMALAAILIALALVGWASLSDPLGVRVLATIAGYAVLIGTFARLDNFYWALMVAPLVPIGLVFAPDALRDLVAAALDRRRVRVQRISR